MNKYSCLFGHNWSKWEFTYNGFELLKIPHQKRVCKTCGKIEIELIKIY